MTSPKFLTQKKTILIELIIIELTSPPSRGTILEYSVLQITESSFVIGWRLSRPKYLSQSLRTKFTVKQSAITFYLTNRQLKDS